MVEGRDFDVINKLAVELAETIQTKLDEGR